ncbi:MAG: hypothetical protein KDB14_28320 [Planctomycetales bacterium]|nr:hypothetical protein [Planctomycetales bacterium]
MSQHHPWWMGVLHASTHHARHGSKLGAWVTIFIGFALAPLLIGIPIMIYGFAMLLK